MFKVGDLVRGVFLWESIRKAEVIEKRLTKVSYLNTITIKVLDSTDPDKIGKIYNVAPMHFQLIKEKREMKLAKIVYDKVVRNGEPVIKIIDIQNVMPLHKLPKEYINCKEMFFLYGEGSVDIRDSKKGRTYNITVGNTYSPEFFNMVIQLMKKAGDNLTKINKEIKELQDNWFGTGEVVI